MSASEIAGFDTKGLQRDTVVRCNTQEEADSFLEYLAFRGVWSESQVKILKERWSEYGDATCYHLSEPSWCYAAYYATEYPHYDIVDFCDIHKAAQESDITDIAYGYDQLFS